MKKAYQISNIVKYYVCTYAVPTTIAYESGSGPFYKVHTVSSSRSVFALNPDPHVSVVFLLSWTRILTENADPDLVALKLTKLNK
jgi:hypothetical protein